MSTAFFPIRWAPMVTPPLLTPLEKQTQFFVIDWRPVVYAVYNPGPSVTTALKITQPKTASPTD